MSIAAPEHGCANQIERHPSHVPPQVQGLGFARHCLDIAGKFVDASAHGRDEAGKAADAANRGSVRGMNAGLLQHGV
jgi:hypothetical protein